MEEITKSTASLKLNKPKNTIGAKNKETPSKRFLTPSNTLNSPTVNIKSRQRQSLAIKNEDIAEIISGNTEENLFVTYMTESLFIKFSGCKNLKEVKILKVSEEDSKIKVCITTDIYE